MRESRSYGSVRGARDETRVPTATIRDPLVGADQQFASTTSIFASNVWYIRSEYAIAYICVYALFGVHIFLARKLCGDRATLLPAIALISILLFSPVGHNNFW